MERPEQTPVTGVAASAVPGAATRKVAFDTALVFLGRMAIMGVGFATTLLLIRLLEPATYGRVATVLTMITIAATFMDFGSSVSLVRFGPHFLERGETEKVGAVFKSVLLLRLAVAAGLGAAVWALRHPIARLTLGSESNADLLVLSFFGALFYALLLYVSSSLQTWQRFGRYTLLNLGDALLKLGIIGALLLLGYRNLPAVVHVYVWVPLLVVVFGVRWIPQNFLRARVSREMTVALFHYSKWNMIANFCMLLYGNMDVLLLAGMRDPVTVAVFSSAMRIAGVFGLVSQSLATVLLPFLSRLQTEAEIFHHLRRAFAMATAVALGLLFVLPVSHSLVTLLAGDRYGASVPVFRILFLDVIVILVTTPLLMLVYAVNRPDIYTYAAIFQLAANILGDLALIPRFGAAGAAWVTLIVRIVTVSGMAVWAIRAYRRKELLVRRII
jgi:O-antigen/teichoic acid export membrane protein